MLPFIWWVNTHPMLHHCGNIVTALAPTLSQYWSQCCGNVHLWILLNVPTMLCWLRDNNVCIHCTNVVFWPKSQLFNNIVTMLAEVSECWDNVQATLCECYGNITRQCCGLPLRQHLGNIVLTLLPMLGTDIDTTFRQHCVNVVSIWVANVGDWHLIWFENGYLFLK